MSGLSRSTRWRLAREGLFPPCVQITERLVGVRESDLLAWIQSRATKGNAAGADVR
jgi:predicted DNA-binding transcriptional regulator AlpA